MSNKKILIVEDENKIAEVLEAYMKQAGYQTEIASDGEMALEKFATFRPDMLVLDLMLPKVSGEEVCRTIRRESPIPIIMLTAKSLEEDKISGLLGGADDYVTKPFSPRELMARIAALFRRITPDGNTKLLTFNQGDLQIDSEAYQVYRAGLPLNLTQSEFKLLSTLALRPQKAFTRDELIDLAFPTDSEIYDRTIDSHIKNLRAKIELDTAAPQYILTVRGVGYKFGSQPD